MNAKTPRLEISLFGPFRAELDGRPLNALKQHHNQGALLALLCLHPNMTLTKDWVIDQLWPQEGRTTALPNHLIVDVQRILEPFETNLSPGSGLLRLDTSGMFVDVAEFDTTWNADSDLETAVKYYQGPLLEDWANWYPREWIDVPREMYRQK